MAALRHGRGDAAIGYAKAEVLQVGQNKIKITDHARNVELGPYVVMPNHVHGIVNLVGNATAFKFVPLPESGSNAAIDNGEFPKTIGQIRFRNPGKNAISTIIGGYKSAVSKDAAKVRCDFGWQSRFHDHIIRDAEEHRRIADYILNNPARWKGDKFYSDPDDQK